MIVLLGTLLLASSAPTTPQEKPLMEAFVEIAADSTASPATHCTQDKRWCAFVSRDVDQDTTTLNIYNGQLPPVIKDGRSYARDVGTYPFSAAGKVGRNASVQFWPKIIRQPTLRTDGLKLNETVIIGIETSVSGAYSGGGAQSTLLRLYQLGPTIDGSVPEPINFGTILDVPLSASKLIRACFGEEDQQKRRGMCHDEYNFQATLKLGKIMPDGTPQLIYQSAATATPGSSRLSKDNSARQLTPADLKSRRDRTCSYRRVYNYNGELGMYFTAKPAPDCSDFTVP